MSAAASDIRLDYSPLRSPRRLDDGSLRVDAVVAWAGRDLDYPWGIEVPTEESLRDPEYHEAARGLPVTVRHPAAGRSTVGDGTRIGTVTGARYDEDLRAAVREYTITDPAVIERVLSRELSETSEGYRVPPEHRRDTGDGRVEQMRRVPNHYALTMRGHARMPGATLRLDEDDIMTEEQIRALIAEALAPLVERLDAMAPTEDETDEVEAVDVEMRADEIAADLVALRTRAQTLGVAIPADVRGVAATAKAIATALGADATRCDSLDYCRGVIDAAPVGRSSDWQPSRSQTTHSLPF